MKKILTIAISIALVAAIAIGGTLAYLTSNAGGKELVNTFVSGSGLSITLFEGKVDSDTGKLLTGSAAVLVQENTYPIIPGETMDKNPTITVVKNSEPCYIFAYITNSATLNDKPVASIVAINSNWHEISTCPGLYVYWDSTASAAKTVLKDKTSDYILPCVFSEIKINGNLDVADLSKPQLGEINVKAFAYQASGDATYAAAEAEAIDLFT